MRRSIATALMFQDGKAEEAMNLYVALFHGTVVQVERYGPEGPGAAGSIKRALFQLAGHDLACMDSPVQHQFHFTPSMSLFVECASEPELEAAFAKLSEGGAVLMPLNNYGFSQKFGWLNDRYGVSWQLNLA
jgi:predicted 3-demethylubiquinone-9 3-methyltransferase (glyoxalase superfamily)